ncbi:hypothetical protein Pmani_006728 [Petrolisthes manimaculis]|uniref:Uncharacterized protein n=1 Tax=Petrolisthes manimaculis TaxID=1843537 RepID=A0AAE1ULH6_9EUCA|nr:hypothetical protein Pmani_006728 [Petrolisthes manimaculis]
MDAVGCDRCSKLFRPTSMCMGIPDQLISGIQDYGGGGVLFVCTECRSSGGSGEGVSASAFNQLFLTVKKLCETVQSLSGQVATMTGVVGSGPAGTGPTAVGNGSSIRESDEGPLPVPLSEVDPFPAAAARPNNAAGQSENGGAASGEIRDHEEDLIE